MKLVKFSSFLISFLIIFSFIFSSNESSLKYIEKVNSLDLSTLKSQISAKQTELNNFQNSLSNLQNSINSLSSSNKVTQTQLNNISLQIEDLESEKNIVIKNLDNLNNQIMILQADSYSKEAEISQKLTQIYKINKSSNLSNNFGLNLDPADKFIANIVKNDQKYVEQIQLNIEELQKLQNEKEEVKTNLINSLNEFNNKKNNLQSKVTDLNKQLNSQLSLKNQTTTKINSISQEISQMSAQQKKLEAAEAAKLKQTTVSVKVDTSQFKSGEFYLKGRGRDLYDGHGVGMSQWGAYGAGKAGFDYQKILKSYFTGVNIAKYDKLLQVTVSGYGIMSVEDYVAGLGEIPSTPCETSSSSNCWPKETIKAQVVAARSYLIYYLQRAGSGATVSSGPDFQVYIGGNAKKWAADETQNEVMTYNGSVVDAVYSSSHRGQSENNELVFTANSVANSKDSIIGTAYPYLRSVSDDSFAYKNQTYNFTWTTDSFTKEQLSTIFSNAEIKVGNISKIITYKGGSNRIWSVGIFGDSGTKYLAGWMFKSILNDYIYANYPADKRAFVYSTEFDLVEVK